jgi:hypothetical protein
MCVSIAERCLEIGGDYFAAIHRSPMSLQRIDRCRTAGPNTSPQRYLLKLSGFMQRRQLRE